MIKIQRYTCYYQDNYGQELEAFYYPDGTGDWCNEEDVKKLELENQELREYIQHKNGCASFKLLNCDCGLNKLLKEK